MKKLLVLFFILSSLCFGSEFRSYTYISFDKCIEILNELNEEYLILSYEIIPLEIAPKFTVNEVETFNMIVEITEWIE